ncbi:cytochrome P450 [Mycena vitilis]|nr:cytochrome P450 [Mycena vitilis]
MPLSPLQSVGIVFGSWVCYLAIRSYNSRKALPPGPPGLPFIGNLFDVPKSQQWLAFIRMSQKYEHRKLLVQQFQPSEVLLHRSTELHAARILLQRLLDSPAKRERHLRHMAGMVILSTVYGIDVLPENDPHIDISEKALHAMACTGNRSYRDLVDSLPFLKYVPACFPGAGFKKQAREWAKAVAAMPVVAYEFVKKSRTVSALGTFILAMVMYPDVQKKAQAAVDDVVGHGRLPDFEDDIPYLFPTRSVKTMFTEATTYVRLTLHSIYKRFNDYKLLAQSSQGTRGMAIFNEEKTYGPNTDQFIPERWLTEDGYISTEMRDSSAAFGFGRRICPGQDMAQWSLWITVASILATFNITKSLDDKGVPIEPRLVTSLPTPF